MKPRNEQHTIMVWCCCCCWWWWWMMNYGSNGFQLIVASANYSTCIHVSPNRASNSFHWGVTRQDDPLATNTAISVSEYIRTGLEARKPYSFYFIECHPAYLPKTYQVPRGRNRSHIVRRNLRRTKESRQTTVHENEDNHSEACIGRAERTAAGKIVWRVDGRALGNRFLPKYVHFQ